MIASIASTIFGSGGLFGTVLDTLKSTGVIPDKDLELKLKQVMMEHEVKLLEYETRAIESVNSAIQAEAKSDHWMQWSWRPTVGFTFSAVIINNYILLPYFAQFGMQMISIPGELWSAMLVVLGVAAGTRGLEKWQKERK